MRAIIFFLVLMVAQGLFAADKDIKLQSDDRGKWFLAGNTGVSYLDVNNQYLVANGDGWPDDWYRNKHVASNGLLSLQFGYMWQQASNWFPNTSLSLNYSYFFPSAAKGRIWQYSLPQFENYNYQFKIDRQALLAYGKSNFWRYHRWMPYVAAGIGGAFNHFLGYRELPVDATVMPRISPAFGESRNTQLSYVLGAGLDLALMDCLWLGVGYQYGYYGHIQSGMGKGGFSADYLKTKLRDNSILLTLTYLYSAGA